MGVGLRDRIDLLDVQQRQKDHWRKCGDRQRKRFGHPPDHHQHRQSRDIPTRTGQSGRCRQCQHSTECDEPYKQTNPLNSLCYRCLVCLFGHPHHIDSAECCQRNKKGRSHCRFFIARAMALALS